MVRRTGRRTLRTIRVETARFVALVIGIAVLVGLVRGGSHYLYCPFMDAVVEDHCCTETREDVSTVQAPDCCETRTIRVLPSAASSTPAPAIHAPSLVAVLPVAQNAGREAVAACAGSSPSHPTGPPPAVGAKRAARLGVFLI